MGFRTLKEAELKGKKVLLRVDFNLPLDKKTWEIKDDERIKLMLPTINHILEEGARKLIVMTHLGRPNGKVVKELSTKKIAERFSELLGENVVFFDQIHNKSIPDDKIVMLENVQFSPYEKENDEKYARQLSKYADVFVMDAFGQSHRNYATLTQIQNFLPSYAGLLVEKEVKMITSAIEDPEHPFIAVLGGVKLETKIPVIKNLLSKVDKILLGGAMIFTFFKIKGLEVGNSIIDEDKLEIAKELLDEAGGKLVFPSDIVISRSLDAPEDQKIVGFNEIPEGFYGVDIGPESIESYKETLSCAKTVIWNGPMGLFELSEFAAGTMEIAEFLADLEAVVIIGGGDSALAVKKAGVAEKVTHISSGGGASLCLFGGQPMPALKALEENVNNFE